MEVSPGTPSLKDRFLHVLSVTDDPNTCRPAVVQSIGSVRLDGAIIADSDGREKTLVLFVREPGKLNEQLNLAGKNTFRRVLVVGLEPGARYTLAGDARNLRLASNPAGASRCSDQGTLFLHWPPDGK